MSRVPVETAKARLLQRLDRDEGVVPAQDDERFAGGNPIDDQLEDGALILRDGHSGNSRNASRQRARESRRAQRGHTPFGV